MNNNKIAINNIMRKIKSQKGNTKKLLDFMDYKSIRAFRKDYQFIDNKQAYIAIIDLYNDMVDNFNISVKKDNINKKKQNKQYYNIIKQSIVQDFSVEELKDNRLIYDFVKFHEITGLYRFYVIGNNTKHIYIDYTGDIKQGSKWYHDNLTKFQNNSEFMKYNDAEYEDIKLKATEMESKTFIFTKLIKLKPKTIKQSFLNGINHCLLFPILEWAKDGLNNTASKSSKERYQTIITKIQGKETQNSKYYDYKDNIPYLKKYKFGIPQDDLQYLCDDLRIGLKITQPFCNTPLVELTSQSKPNKIFKYVNTRLNHVEKNENTYTLDTIHYDDLKNAITMSRDDMDKLFTSLYETKEDFIYKKDSIGISIIQTMNTIYKISNEFLDTCNKFEFDTGLKHCSIDAKKYPELTNFISMGTHFNGTVDFIEDINKNKQKLVECDKIKHIDMTKAYTQFHNCEIYSGFCGKITDFRECDNYKQKGLYFITNLDLSNCNEKFKQLIIKLGWFINDNIYNDTELTMLENYGGKFDVKYGAYGMPLFFKFDNDMTQKKDTDGVPYYSKWTGIKSMTNEKQSIYMCPRVVKNYNNYGIDSHFTKTKSKTEDNWVKYLQSIQDNTDAQVFYDGISNEANIQFDKKYINHIKHITSQILSYQRIIMIEQLMKMDIEKLIRICVDGIYYKEHDFKIHNSFSVKTKKTFNNSPCEDYLSSLNKNGDNHIVEICGTDEYIPKAKSRIFYKRELFIGGGGSGKTHMNLTDTGLINVCFIAPSWKLASNKQQEFKNISSTVLYRLIHKPYHVETINRYNNLIIDEASMITEYDKQIIFNTTMAKVIFCGDLGYQLPPVVTDKDKTFIAENKKHLMVEMNSSGFDNIQELTTNFRSGGCKKLMKLIKHLREIIKNNPDTEFEGIKTEISKILQTITKKELQTNYNALDLIICSENILKDEYTNMFEHIEKYRVKNNSRDYKNGSIIYKSVKNIQKQLQHGFTIHSIQGETATTNLYIDLNRQKSIRMLYTAISRAKNIDQIYLIK